MAKIVSADLIRRAQGTQLFGVGDYEAAGTAELEFAPYVGRVRGQVVHDGIGADPPPVSYALNDALSPGRVAEIKRVLQEFGRSANKSFLGGWKEQVFNQITLDDVWEDEAADEYMATISRLRTIPKLASIPDPLWVAGTTGPQPSVSGLRMLSAMAVDQLSGVGMPLFDAWWSAASSAPAAQVVPTERTSFSPTLSANASAADAKLASATWAVLSGDWQKLSLAKDEDERLALMLKIQADRKQRNLAFAAANYNAIVPVSATVGCPAATSYHLDADTGAEWCQDAAGAKVAYHSPGGAKAAPPADKSGQPKTPSADQEAAVLTSGDWAMIVGAGLGLLLLFNEKRR